MSSLAKSEYKQTINEFNSNHRRMRHDIAVERAAGLYRIRLARPLTAALVDRHRIAMSYDGNDAAYHRFTNELDKQFREQALDDAELYDKIVDDFKTSRVRAFYVLEPLVAEAAQGTLREATDLLIAHPRAALLLAIIAAEACLRGALLTPLQHGAFHTEASAGLSAHLVAGAKDEKLVRLSCALSQPTPEWTFKSIGGPPLTKALWQKMHDLQVKRGAVVHQAELHRQTYAQQAIAVAETVLTGVFQRSSLNLGRTFRRAQECAILPSAARLLSWSNHAAHRTGRSRCSCSGR